MKKTLLSALIVLGTICAEAQNLVRNPSFEDASKKFTSIDLDRKGRKYLIKDWYAPLAASPDFLTPYISSISPVLGNGEVGFMAASVVDSASPPQANHEVLTAGLTSTLEAGQEYCICMHLALHNTSEWSTNNIGIKLHAGWTTPFKSKTTPPVPDLYANRKAQITNMAWQQYCGTYIAKGNERYISLGTFGEPNIRSLKEQSIEGYGSHDQLASTAYYIVDQVSVEKKVDGICGCSDPMKPDATPKQRLEKNYSFIVDVSSSMNKEGVFDSLRTSLHHLITDMNPDAYLNVISFDSRAHLLFEGRRSDLKEGDVGKMLDALRLSGGTNAYAGVRAGFNSSQQASAVGSEMVLISDGNFNVSQRLLDMVKYNYNEYRTTLNIIHIENEAEDLDKLKPYKVNYQRIVGSELTSTLDNLREFEKTIMPCPCEHEEVVDLLAQEGSEIAVDQTNPCGYRHQLYRDAVPLPPGSDRSEGVKTALNNLGKGILTGLAVIAGGALLILSALSDLEEDPDCPKGGI